MSTKKVYTLNGRLQIEIEILDEYTNRNYFFDEKEWDRCQIMWQTTIPHSKNLNCEAEWLPLVTFCLMWSTTMAQPEKMNLSWRLAEGNSTSQIVGNIITKLISDKVPEDYIFEYDSRLYSPPNLPNPRNTNFRFKFKFEQNIDESKLLRNFFKEVIPYQLEKIKCKYFMRPYGLKWDKTENPHIVVFNDRNIQNKI